MNYALYVSATSIGMDSVDSERHVGGRTGFFLPGPRLEIGASWQRTLQDDRKNAFGFHMGWQPAKVPLSVRAEYAHAFEGSGYWAEGAYRLSQAQLLAQNHAADGNRGARSAVLDGASVPSRGWLGLPDVNTRETDFGVNYFFVTD